jgi:hypothetical protein
MNAKVNRATVLSNATTAGRFQYGEVVEFYDATYGLIKAMYCKIAKAAAEIGSPMFLVNANFNVAGGFQVSDDENGSGVMGQEGCVGALLAVATDASEGFVQCYGLNLVALKTDGNVTAGQMLYPSTTDGEWQGINVMQTVTEDGSSTYTVHNSGGGSGCGLALAADDGTELEAGEVFLNTFVG